MFQNDFYTIVKQNNIDGGVLVEVKFNPNHKIYQAHFPQNPITPGVMLIEIVKELLEEFYQFPLVLSVAKSVKFLHVVNPLEYPEVDYKILTSLDTDGTIKASVSVEKKEVVFAKIVNVYKKTE
jgi:3-hydroxyacyl-[acyl-carrier-protein] dehydratase